MRFGQRLREHRLTHGRPATEVAERVGVSRTALYAWESNEARPTSENLAALCELYGLNNESRGELLRLLAPESASAHEAA